MQYKALAFAATLAMGVSAQSGLAPEVSESVISVLLTALPSSDLALAYTNPGAFQSAMYSSLSAGNIPDWYQSLPSDVKTILPQLYPAEAAATPTADSTSSSEAETTSTAVETSTAVVGTISGKPTGGANVTSTVNSPTLSRTSSGSGAPSQTSNGASVPTAVIGSGIAGALGVFGMLLL
jgi:hypothetical protein